MTLRSNIPILLLLGFTFTTLLTPVTATHKVNDKCTNKNTSTHSAARKVNAKWYVSQPHHHHHHHHRKATHTKKGTLPPPITHFPQLLIHSFINSHSSNASKNPTATTHISGEYKKPVKICSVRMELVIRIFRIWIVLPKMGGEKRGREREGERGRGRRGRRGRRDEGRKKKDGCS